MIFGGSDAIWSKRQHKVRYREACAAETVVPSFLSWSESPITFDKRDHPSHVVRPGCYPLIIDPIIRKKRLTKVLMDRGSGLNILYVDTCNTLGVWLLQNCISFHNHVHHLSHLAIVLKHVYATFSIIFVSYLIACEW